MNNTILKKPAKALIIAEVGSVHDGSFGNAIKLIDLAAECGADIVKFQTHIAEAETLRDAPMPPFFKGEPRYEYFQRTGFSKHQWQDLKDHAGKINIGFLSSPFSIEAVALLEDIGVEYYKIPSGELTNIPLLQAVGKTQKHVFLSSGMSSWSELDSAVAAIKAFHSEITVLQCTTEYPCEYENVGMNVMIEMRDRYGLPVGFSDHTMTNYSAFIAIALGASVIEKHLTFSRKMYGSDASHSLESDEFKDLVTGIRATEIIMKSSVDKDQLALEKTEMKQIFQKSIVAIVDIPAGTLIREEMLGFKKPGTGISPAELPTVCGKHSARTIKRNEIIQRVDLVND